MEKKLYRIRNGKKITGVCGGIAKYFNIDVKIVRLLWLAFCLACGSGILAYLLFTIFIPKEPINQ